MESNKSEGRYTLVAIAPVATSGPTNAHQNDHCYTSGHYTAESRPDWPDSPDNLPPSSPLRASTNCKSIPPRRPRSHPDAGARAPESQADDWATVSRRSPDLGH